MLPGLFTTAAHCRHRSPTLPRARRLRLSAARPRLSPPARQRRGSPRAGRNRPVMPRPHGSPRNPRSPPAPRALNCVTAAHRHRRSPPPLAAALLVLAAPSHLITLADHIFSASCGVKYHGQAHHRLTSTLPRSPGIITPPPAAAAPHPYPPASPAHQSFPPRRAPATPHPPPPPPPSQSPPGRRSQSPHSAGAQHCPPITTSTPTPLHLCPRRPSTSAQVKPIIKSF
jgi:hypothetical protein